jgi:translation initiation factor 1
VISGLTLDAAQLEELAARLKRLCGAGGAVKNGRIEIQGDHRDRLVAELGRQGIPAKRAGG